MSARQSDRWVMEEFDRLGLLIAVSNAWAEEGENLAPRPVGKRVEQAHVISVVEGHSPLLAVEENADPLKGRAELQPGPGLGASWTLVPVTEPQSPKSVFGTQLDPCAPVHCVRGHTQVPFGLRAHFDLPVVPAWLEALGSQDVNTLEETLVVVHVQYHAVTLECDGFVPGHSNARVCCLDVEC